MYKVLEPLHAMIYFAPEAQAEYTALGLDNQAKGYFPSRGAALGRASAAVVAAAFYSFSPALVGYGMAGVWDEHSPEELVAARLRAVDAALRRMCGDLVDDVAAPLALVREAAAACPPEGRALHAGQAALAEPSTDLLALWHGIAVLREFRGDGHLTALLAAGITAPQSLVLQGAFHGAGMEAFLKATRGWSPEQWDGARAELVDRGWLDVDGALTDAGTAARDDVEAVTDRLALAPWARLGAEGTGRLGALLQPLSDAVVASGGLPVARRR